MAFRPVYSSSKQKLIGSYGRIRTPLFEQMCVDIGGDGSLSVPKLPRNINQVLSVLELGQNQKHELLSDCRPRGTLRTSLISSPSSRLCACLRTKAYSRTSARLVSSVLAASNVTAAALVWIWRFTHQSEFGVDLVN